MLREFKKATFDPFFRSSLFKSVVEGTYSNSSNPGLNLHLHIVDDGSYSLLKGVWRWTSAFTLGIIPFYTKAHIRYELKVMNDKQEIIKNISYDYWQSIFLISEFGGVKDKLIKVLSEVSDMAIGHLSQEGII